MFTLLVAKNSHTFPDIHVHHFEFKLVNGIYKLVSECDRVGEYSNGMFETWRSCK